MRYSLFTAAVVAAVALSGCGDVPRSSIHGTVKFQGKPLTDATVIFIASDNKTHPVNLKADGSFQVSGVAQGSVKTSIQQALPRVAARPDPTFSGASKGGVVDEKASASRRGPPPSKNSGPRLPEKYADSERSGLGFDLKQPDQEWSVDLQ